MKEILPKTLFFISLAVIVYAYGYFSHRLQLFPAKIFVHFEEAVNELLAKVSDELPFQYSPTSQREPLVRNRPEAMAPGLTLITRVGKDDKLLAEVLDPEGQVVHQWSLDWFDIWPNATHLAESRNPKEPPGTHIHGAILMDNGDLIFNFEQLGMARVDIHSRVVWRLPRRTHHSIYQAESGNLWVPGMITHEEPLDWLSYYLPEFDEYTILEIEPSKGQVLREFSLFKLFQGNDLHGLLYLSSLGLHPESQGDTLHLNDVELFPDHLTPGFFQPGDVMISLRNINAILVFDLETGKKKFLSTGPFVRQHDPDFIDGDTISIFDNNDSAPASSGVQSRILLQDAPSGDVSVAYQGSPEHPFFTDLLGKHEWQKNGNILITDSRNGRVFEVDPDGEILWEYYNIIEDGVVGLVETAHRLPERFSADFFEQARSQSTRLNGADDSDGAALFDNTGADNLEAAIP
jgi:hypothetical protein